eukprot:7377593-Prymnesium_polylepis.1
METLAVNPGRWRLAGSSLETVNCHDVSGTDGSKPSPCQGGVNSGVECSGYCREGHSGVRCELCTSSSQYFSQGECVDCPTAQDRVAFFIGTLVGAPLVAFGGSHLISHAAPHAHRRAVTLANLVIFRVSSLALIPQLKL